MKQNIFKALAALALSTVLVTCVVNAAAEHMSDTEVKNTGDNIKAPVSAAEVTQVLSEDNKDIQPTATKDGEQSPEAVVTQVPAIKVKVKKWDEEKLKALFISPEDSFEYTERPAQMFNEGRRCLYDGVKGTDKEEFWLGYETGNLTAEYQSNMKGHLHLASALKVYDYGDYFGDKDLSLFTREDAKNMVSPILAQLGITNAGEPEIHAFTAENANEYLAKDGYGAKGDLEFTYPTWSKEDEMYILTYPLVYDGLPLTTESLSKGELDGKFIPYSGSYIEAVVTKDKILSIRGFNVFSSDYEKGESVTVKCDYESALEKGKDYYKNYTEEFNNTGYMGTYDYQIESCQLVYTPYFDDDEYAELYTEKEGLAITEDYEFTLIPVWKVDATLGHSENYLSYQRKNECIFINAQTGEVM